MYITYAYVYTERKQDIRHFTTHSSHKGIHIYTYYICTYTDKHMCIYHSMIERPRGTIVHICIYDIYICVCIVVDKLFNHLEVSVLTIVFFLIGTQNSTKEAAKARKNMYIHIV